MNTELLSLLQIKVLVKDISPTIYRTLLVPYTATFYDLHVYIQDAFDLGDYHLFMFQSRISTREHLCIEAPYNTDWFDERSVSAYTTRIIDVLKTEKSMCTYWYDFGDDWHFFVELQRIVPYDQSVHTKVPMLLKAKGPNLLEDCRGNWGFEDFLEIYHSLKSKKSISTDQKERLSMYFESKSDFLMIMDILHEYAVDEIEFTNPEQRLKDIQEHNDF